MCQDCAERDEDFNDTDAMEFISYELNNEPKDCNNCGHVWAEDTCHYCGESLND